MGSKPPGQGMAPAGNYRWFIIGLLFVITTINYMDRNLLAVLNKQVDVATNNSEELDKRRQDELGMVG